MNLVDFWIVIETCSLYSEELFMRMWMLDWLPLVSKKGLQGDVVRFQNSEK